jgi:dihydromethanopterin reductase (acceptor)
MSKENKKSIVWCVTGAGQFLEESCEFIKKLSEREHKITLAFSGAGYEVARMYGMEGIKKYAKSVVLEEEQGRSAPFSGRLNKKNYDFVVVAPATANTVAKIVYGIADTLVTNIVAQAGKQNIPVFILPTDAKKYQETKIPMSINLEKCTACKACISACPNNAIFITGSGKLKINLMFCNACGKCKAACSYGAIGFGKIIKIQCREVDMENVKRIRKSEGIKVIESLEEIKMN